MALPKDGDFSKLLGKGENPNGFVSQTANGTLIDGRGGDGENYAWGGMADGPRWNQDPRRDDMSLAPTAPIPVRRKK
jgi:hypothetical protein